MYSDIAQQSSKSFINITRNRAMEFSCDQCGYQAKVKCSLTKHQQSVHVGKKYLCGECNIQFTQKGNLSSHQQAVHMGNKYPCVECGYQTTAKRNLTSHQQIVHMGKKWANSVVMILKPENQNKYWELYRCEKQYKSRNIHSY